MAKEMLKRVMGLSNEYAETHCFECEMPMLKIKAVEVIRILNPGLDRINVQWFCKCENCGHPQTVSLVEMP